MMNGPRSLCTLQQLKAEPESSADLVKTLRLTLQNDLATERPDCLKQKPVGRAFAVISSRPPSRSQSLDSELVKSANGDEEIIKVYLKAKAENKMKHDWNVTQLRNEVRHIQEVNTPWARTSLCKLREEISRTIEKTAETALGQEAKDPVERRNGLQHHVSSWNREASTEAEEEFPGRETETLRETTKKLLAKLQDAEKRHQSDRRAFEDTLGHYRKEVEESNRALKKAEDDVAVKQMKMEEMQRLMGGMEKEHRTLLDKLTENEKELEEVRTRKEKSRKEQDRCAELEKEVASLREKIHHLDDMLKSQQRKVRNMIEQLQNARMLIQEKDRIIHELQERVSSLQAENLEMRDRMEQLLGYRLSPSSSVSKSYTQSMPVNGKRGFMPPGPLKPLPLIRVVET
ncbi:tuftelin isoform X2 [Microcaecilia unicolor]|uniref:Tuftelin isoform X2 n=1 Tax=Microcaecilia unicolor TaxID=1415580 RepID=A0A6P7WRM2_9AMPH|nr:tuftelin isoform X2 [Microcaecilia unicolor]